MKFLILIKYYHPHLGIGLEDVKKGWVSKVYDDVDEMKEDLDL